MKVIGITGVAGSGKSRICGMLTALGFKVIDSDAVTKSFYYPGSPVLDEIAKCFGSEFIKEDGNLDRSRTAALVFNDETALEKLNAITHPPTLRKIGELLDGFKASGERLAFVESAIPYAADYGDFCDEFWCVWADREELKRRMISNRGYSEERAEAVLASQKPERLWDMSEHIIFNYNGLKDEKLSEILKRLTSCQI